MHILITGGTGFIGWPLANRLVAAGHLVYLLVRQTRQSTKGITYIISENATECLPDSVITKLDVIINLAGRSISDSSRWTESIKADILASRISRTNQIVDSLLNCQKRGLPIPKLLISASAIGYYGNHPEGPLTEDSPSENGFLASVCRQWETAALKARAAGVNVVILRLGIVLGTGGGVLTKMSLPFRLGLGGIIGSGSQRVSWIHRDDLLGLIEQALGGAMSGVYNATAPNSSNMQDFGQQLGKALGKPCWTKLPAWLARLLFGEVADEVLLCSQQVSPKAVLEMGFIYRYPTLESAFQQIYPQALP